MAIINSKEKQFKTILENSFNEMREHRIGKVLLGTQVIEEENQLGGWIDMRKKSYFLDETIMPEERELINDKVNYSVNLLLMKYDNKGNEMIGVYEGNRFWTHLMSIFEPNPTYITNAMVTDKLDYVAKELVAQKFKPKHFAETVRTSIERAKEFQTERYNNEIQDKTAYELSKQLLEERNAPADEQVFAAIRNNIKLADTNKIYGKIVKH